MSGRTFLPSIVTACLLILGLGFGPSAVSAGQIAMSSDTAARNGVVEIKYRKRSPWFSLPIAPSYLAYDYPYYYSRGHYPTHIPPGYVYYGYRLRTAPNAPIGTGYATPMGR
jgi:hypothetical protein